MIIVVSFLAAVLGIFYANVHVSIAVTTMIGALLVGVIYAGYTVGFSTYVPELFPTEVRLRGNGLSNTAGRFGAVFAPQAVAILFAFDGVNAVAVALGILLCVQAVIMWIWGIDMTGRSLESLEGETARAGAAKA